MECPYILELPYSDFTARLNNAKANRRYPLAGSLELTFRCNLRCKHCYLTFGHTGVRGQEELALSEIQRIIDEIVDAGTLYLLLTGGEPLMRRDFMDIYLYAKRKGLLVTLFTNGTMLTPRILDLLADYRPHNVEITLYGYTQKTYENVTGIPGSHARCYRGIDQLHKRGIKLKLKSTILTLNQHEIQQMRHFGDSIGVSFRYDAQINSGLDGDRTPHSFRLEPAEIVRMELLESGGLKNYLTTFEKSKKLDKEKTGSDYSASVRNSHYLYTCGAGMRGFHVDPYGRLSACLTARKPFYNLREGTFKNGWEEFIPKVRQQKVVGVSECVNCNIRSLCSQCPGWSQLEHGDSQSRVKFLCDIAHQRNKIVKLLAT
jgi:radical SAM protein with 4Fe4S-binding SPASM domain